MLTDRGISLARRQLMKAATELEAGISPPGLDPLAQAVRSASFELDRAIPFDEAPGEPTKVKRALPTHRSNKRSIIVTDKLDPRAAGARRFKDKICVITGAGQGIGRATARRLGQEGGKIVIADRIDETATSTLKELHEHDVEATKVIVDLSNYKGAKGLMNEARSTFGRIDVLINNVGGTIWMKPFHLYTEEEVEMELERSLMPTLWGCRAVLPIMMEQQTGSIVNIGSQSVRGYTAYPTHQAKVASSP